MYVLDTNVVSELRKVRFGKADAQVAKWADSVDAVSLYVSAITILELEMGVLQMESRDPAKAQCCAHGWTTMCCQSLWSGSCPLMRPSRAAALDCMCLIVARNATH